MGAFLMHTRESKQRVPTGATALKAAGRVIDKLVGVGDDQLKDLPDAQKRKLRGALLNDKHSEASIAAAQSLMHLSGAKRDITRIVEALIGVLPNPDDEDQDQDKALGEQAAETLRFLTNQDFSLDQKRWWDWSQSPAAKKYLVNPAAALPKPDAPRTRGRRRRQG